MLISVHQLKYSLSTNYKDKQTFIDNSTRFLLISSLLCHLRESHSTPLKSSPPESIYPNFTALNFETEKSAAASISTVTHPSDTLSLILSY